MYKTRRAFASVRSCKIWVRVIVVIVVVLGENKVQSYFVGFAQQSYFVGFAQHLVTDI